MEYLKFIIRLSQLYFILSFIFCHNLQAQVDTTKQVTEDPPLAVVNDSTKTIQKEENKTYKRISDFKIYGGISLSQVAESGQKYSSGYSTGFNAGFAYRRGRFAYWELGARYNGSIVLLNELSENNEETLQIGQLEVPALVGLNLLSPLRRVFGLRLFAGVSPGYIIAVSDNNLNLTKDDFNSFQISGQAGVGIDVLFLFIDVGINRGFNDLFKDNNSQLMQGFVNLGFRF